MDGAAKTMGNEQGKGESKYRATVLNMSAGVHGIHTPVFFPDVPCST